MQLRTADTQWLLDNDVEIYAADHAGVTPLHLACLKGHIEIISLLLNQGCGTETRDNEGDTAMHWAATKVSVAAQAEHPAVRSCFATIAQ